MYSSILLALPLVITAIIMMADAARSRTIALAGSVIVLVWCLIILYTFETGGNQFLEQLVTWIPALGISYHVGLDGISMVLVLLTALLFPFIIAATQKDVASSRSFYALMMLMQAGLLGVFMARDVFLFYVAYEVTLVPVYFICALWGGSRRIPVTLKFFIYTLAGSLFMLVAILYLYFKTPAPHQFSLESFYGLPLTDSEQSWIFWGFFLAFAVKIPIFPFHTWQPDTYTVSPLAGTMLLAGIMLKMGIYGLIRFVLPIVPGAVEAWGTVAMVLCITGILYASLIALRQNDLKTLIAYSSIAHVGLIAAGTLTGTVSGLQGAVIQMFNHGVNVVALFFMIDLIERRYGTRWISDLSGVAGHMKKLSWMFMIILLGSIGLPLTNGFAGEFLLLNGLYRYGTGFAIAAGLTLILGAAYMLRMYRDVFLGEIGNLRSAGGDLTKGEMLVILPLCFLVMLIGFFPGLVLHISEESVTRIVELFHQTSQAGL